MESIKINLMIARDMATNFRQMLTIHTLTLQEVRQEGENIKTFIFKSNKELTYEPGQYGIWILNQKVSGKLGRLFSVASPPEDNELWMSTRISKTDFKKKLSRLKPGETVKMLGPIGSFTLPKKNPDRVVLIAGGIGITPMRALAKRINNRSLPVNTTLIHSAKNFYLYKDEMNQLVNKALFVTSATFEDTLTQAVRENGLKGAYYYLSGPPAFVTAAEKLLKKLGVKNIKKDGFLGY